MKRAALIGLLTWMACTAGYWYGLHDRMDRPWDGIVPVAAGFVMAVLIGTLRIAAQKVADALRVQLSGRAGGPPRHGELATVAGAIRPTGEPLRGPISGAPAVLYVYQIDHLDPYGREGRAIRDFSGFGLAPSAIDTPHGPIRLLGFPQLEGVATVTLDSEEAIAQVGGYLAATAFTDMKAFSPGAIYREVKDLLTDDDGCVRKDWRMSDDTDLSDKILTEQRVAPGEPVCAFGLYSAEKGGLVPDLDAGQPLRLVLGEPQTVSRVLWRSAIGTLTAAVVMAVVVNAAIFGVLRAREAQPHASGSAASLDDAVRAGDLAAAERLVRRGSPVGAREYDGSTPLAHAPDAKTAAWLIAHGADVDARDQDGQTVLMEQSTSGHTDVVQLLVKAGAKLDTVSTKWKSTALMQALDAQQMAVAEILRAAGAQDETVTQKNGAPIGDDSAPVRVCLAYLDAIQREDRAAISRLSTRPESLHINFGVWKRTRPARARVVTGFANDGAATILLRGPANDGSLTNWTYQLARRSGHWTITRERWESRLDP